jgi:3-dehydroquinate dehydratase-1
MTIDRRAVLNGGLAGMALAAAPDAGAAPAPRPSINPLRIRDVTIGEGRPALIVSIAEKAPAAALARKLAAMAEVDLLEYRIDHLTAHDDADLVAASVAQVAQACAGKPC